MQPNLMRLSDIQFAFVLSHFFVSEQILSDDIRRLYEKDELKYYGICKEAGIDFNQLYQKYPYAKSEQMQMCFGMCYEWIQSERLHKIYPLCRKAFPFAWDYIRVNRKFDGQDFLRKWTKKYSLEKYPLQYVLKSYYIAITLGKIKGHAVEYDEIFAEKVEEYIANVLAECEIPSLPMADNQYLETENENIRLLIEKMMGSQTLLESFRAVFLVEHQSVEPIAHQLVGKCYCNRCIQTKEDHQVQEQLLYEKVIRQGNAQWMKILDALFQTIGLDAPSFSMNISVDQQQLFAFFNFLKEAKENYQLSDDVDLPCLFFYLYTVALYTDYKKIRAELYALPSQSMYLSEMEKYGKREMEILQEKQVLEQDYQKEKRENAHLRQLIEDMREEARIESQRVRQALSEREDFSKEVRALRAHIIESNRQVQETDAVISEEVKIQALKKRQIVIVGGSYQWQKKLKQAVPEMICIYTDDYLKHLDLLKKSAYVFINTSVLSHNAYYKLMQVIRKSETTLFYLKDYRNVSLTISEIYACMYA